MSGGWAAFYRLRHGNVRVIFLHDTAAGSIIIAHVGPRGDVFK
jgi:mRNA interferase RelE/StbE